VHIIRQICAALEAAHAQGVIHRDMKPENVFRVRRGEDPDFIKVLDFGIAKIIDENYDPDQPSQTTSGLMGTPEYVAPELIRGLTPDARVDIYAVGVILYRLLAGRVPFAGESFMATLTAHLMEAPRDPREVAPDAEIPEAIAAACMRSLAKDRDQRFPTIRDLSTPSPPSTPPTPNTASSSRTPSPPPPLRRAAASAPSSASSRCSCSSASAPSSWSAPTHLPPRPGPPSSPRRPRRRSRSRSPTRS
jgi:serine/threonine protein kinase